MRSVGVLVASCLLASAFAASATGRPPQYVAISFDGAQHISQWERSRKLARESGARFTYFLSCVYLLPPEKRHLYHGPQTKPGRSNVGFAASRDDAGDRLRQIWAARLEGHEIASHGCGHFDGKDWSAADWRSEFDAFTNVVSSNPSSTARSFVSPPNPPPAARPGWAPPPAAPPPRGRPPPRAGAPRRPAPALLTGGRLRPGDRDAVGVGGVGGGKHDRVGVVFQAGLAPRPQPVHCPRQRALRPAEPLDEVAATGAAGLLHLLQHGVEAGEASGDLFAGDGITREHAVPVEQLGGERGTTIGVGDR
jgi:hypothetical protein